MSWLGPLETMPELVRRRVDSMLMKPIRDDEWTALVGAASDEDRYAMVRAWVQCDRATSADTDAEDRARAQALIRPMVRICAKMHCRRFLDFGCDRGALTHELARAFRSYALGVDVRASAIDHARPSRFVKFLQISRDWVAADLDRWTDGCDMIVLSMVLHHLPLARRDALFDWLRTRPRLHVLLREHDCPDADFAAYLELVHGLYAMTGEDLRFLERGVGERTYESADRWIELLAPRKCVGIERSKNNATRSFSALFASITQ